MAKTFNVLCYDRNDTSEKIIVKVKASNYKEAKYLVERERTNYVVIQTVYSNFNKLERRYYNAFNKIKKIGVSKIKDLFDECPHIDPYVFLLGNYISIDDLEKDSIYLNDAGNPMPLYAFSEEPVTINFSSSVSGTSIFRELFFIFLKFFGFCREKLPFEED